MKNLGIFLILGILLIGTLTFINLDKNNPQEIKVEKNPFQKDLPELQKKIDYNINKYYYKKYNQKRVIFEWD